MSTLLIDCGRNIRVVMIEDGVTLDQVLKSLIMGFNDRWTDGGLIILK